MIAKGNYLRTPIQLISAIPGAGWGIGLVLAVRDAGVASDSFKLIIV